MNIETNTGFGSHLMIDCYGCPKEKLSDASFIREALSGLPARINLTKIGDPHVFKYQSQDASECGVTGVVMIAESHISLHTFPDNGHIFIDVFGTSDFDVNLARQQLLEIFEASDHKVSHGTD